MTSDGTADFADQDFDTRESGFPPTLTGVHEPETSKQSKTATRHRDDPARAQSLSERLETHPEIAALARERLARAQRRAGELPADP